MQTPNFQLTLTTAQPAAVVFQAVINVRAWWVGYFGEEIIGATEKLHDEFSFRAGDGAHYSRQRLVEVVPGKCVVWLITESELDFIQHRQEWTGSRVRFDIAEADGTTTLVFTHEGLTPDQECYGACAPAWTQYLQHKLLPLIQAQAV